VLVIKREKTDETWSKTRYSSPPLKPTYTRVPPTTGMLVTNFFVVILNSIIFIGSACPSRPLSLTLACLWRIFLLLFWIRSFLLAAHVRHVLSLTHSVKAKLLVHLSRSSEKYLCAHGQGDIERSIDHPKLPNVTRRWDLLVCCPSRKVIGLQPQTAKWPTASYRSGWWSPTN
jgi:hypothetical protein